MASWKRLLGLKRCHTFDLLCAIHTAEPCHAALDELLDLGLEFGLLEVKVVDSTDSQNAQAGESLAHAVHERAAGAAEVVRHLLSGADSLGLAERLEILLAAEMLEVAVIDGKVGGEHRGSDLSAVAAVADKGVD